MTALELACPTPAKRRYATRAAADDYAARHDPLHGDSSSPYVCCCGWWHLTTHARRPLTRVVRMNGHVRDRDWLADVVYVGRDQHQGGWKLARSPFANPYSIKTYGRKGAIERYQKWVPQQPELMARLPDLRGRLLGCWCVNEDLDADLKQLRAARAELVCHGQVLAELADAYRRPALLKEATA